MARRRTCRCGEEFTPPLFALTKDARQNCKICRRGLLVTPAEQRQGAWRTFTIAPWTDTTTTIRPTVMGTTKLPQVEVVNRATALGRANFPTLAEREDDRRAKVLAYVRQSTTVYEAAVTAALDRDGDPEPACGGSWGNVDLAEVIEA